MHRLSFQSHWTGDSFILQMTNNKRTLTIIPLNLRLTLSLNLTRQMGERKQKKSKTVFQGNYYPEESGHQQMHAAKPAQKGTAVSSSLFFFGTHSEHSVCLLVTAHFPKPCSEEVQHQRQDQSKQSC